MDISHLCKFGWPLFESEFKIVKIYMHIFYVVFLFFVFFCPTQSQPSLKAKCVTIGFGFRQVVLLKKKVFRNARKAAQAYC